MKKQLLAIAALFLASLPLAGGEETKLGEKDFKLGDFVVTGGKFNVSYADDICTVSIPPQPGIVNDTRGAVFNLPLEKVRGKGIKIRAEVRYENIAFDPGNPHSGGKILCYSARSGVKAFTVSPTLKGTNMDWQAISLDVEFPSNIDDYQIVFGIQQGWGKLQFRNVFIEEFPMFDILPETPANFKCEYSDRVLKAVPRRGVMSPPPARLTAKDLEDLASWNVNLIRYQIVDNSPDPTNIKEFSAWFNSALDHLDSLMPLLKKYDIQVIVDMHYVLGGRFGKAAEGTKYDPSHFRAMHLPEYHDAFVELWKKTAERFKGNPQIYAFDLCNEPIQHGETPYSFWQLQYDAAKAIREVDPEVPVMVESNHMANPTFFEMAPMDIKNIIYSVHMYAPGEYTHQGVSDASYIKTFYEKRFDYRDAGWDRARLAGAMAAVRAFEQKYGAKIQVGEFSVAVWAPGGASYLDELVSIFEEYKWDWTYHAFREWDGWSLEHEGTPMERKYTGKTDRLDVMLKYFKRNKK